MTTTEKYLAKENTELRKAGCELAEAALHVIREYDGLHRLALQVAKWSQAVANEGGRGDRHGDDLPQPVPEMVARAEEDIAARRTVPLRKLIKELHEAYERCGDKKRKDKDDSHRQ